MQGQLTAAYVFGEGDDAPRDEFLLLLEQDVEAEIRREKQQMHEHWARDWRPHRPAEAAWF
ncbi:hypothetical protein [Ralstonia solanacearum]|uniref:hypothetical protein n=1 Tax=Ralstonia solanacearum TaxID=305 RepID=UPI0011C48E4D|nr:hypothetical protein [Ralstonia solanacearum]